MVFTDKPSVMSGYFIEKCLNVLMMGYTDKPSVLSGYFIEKCLNV